MQENINLQSQPQMEEDEGFDLKKFLPIIILNWPWILLSVLVCVGTAFTYLHFKPKVYSGRCKVFIKDGNRMGGRYRSASGLDLSQMGLITSTDGFENELEMVNSTFIASRAVRSLKLYVSYAEEHPVVNRELYKNTPVIVDLEDGRIDELEDVLNLTIAKHNQSKLSVNCMVGNRDTVVYSNTKIINELPAEMSTPYGRILLTPNPGFEIGERKLLVTIAPPMSIARGYAARLACEPTSKTTSIAQLTFVDTQPARLLEYLNAVVQFYNVDANDDKDDMARQTEAFINERLEVIRHELDSTEINLQHFKQTNELTDLVNNASTALQGTNEFQRQQVEMQTQMSIVKSLIDYVNNPVNAHKSLPSSSLIASSPTVSRLIETYNQTVAERNRLLKTSSENSPVIVKLTETLEYTLPTIQQALHTHYNDMATQKRSIDEQFARFTGKVASAPGQERTLTNIMRQREIQSSLYLTLLQKREENAIALASVAEKARIIDPPMLDGGHVSPKGSTVLGMALLLGLMFPIGIIFLKQLLHYRIEGRADVERLSKLTILADIPLYNKLDANKGERAVVVKENSNNMMEEAFRGLRTNMRFVMTGNENVLLVTSVIPGEGKTFVATNLAMSMALLGKKVILLGLDIRKPRLVKLFDLQGKNKGLTNYLMSDGEDLGLLDQQIFRGILNPNLDVLPAGIIPPNPAELIARPQLAKAVAHLRKEYDFVIIDTPPVGLVTDTFDIAPLADASLIVCRSEYSPKGNFELINNINAQGKMPKMNLVINAVNLARKKYGYYYGYGKYGRYGRYGGHYGHYGHYGTYGHYGDTDKKKGGG